MRKSYCDTFENLLPKTIAASRPRGWAVPPSAVVAILILGSTAPLAKAADASKVNEVQQLAPDVYFHEGDIKGHGHCNNGWVIFEDYVLVIDGNFPSGAKEIIPKIRALTDKP